MTKDQTSAGYRQAGGGGDLAQDQGKQGDGVPPTGPRPAAPRVVAEAAGEGPLKRGPMAEAKDPPLPFAQRRAERLARRRRMRAVPDAATTDPSADAPPADAARASPPPGAKRVLADDAREGGSSAKPPAAGSPAAGIPSPGLPPAGGGQAPAVGPATAPPPSAGAPGARLHALRALPQNVPQKLPVPVPEKPTLPDRVRPAQKPPPEPPAADHGVRLARPVRRRPRHVLVILSFVVMVALPSLVSGIYLFFIARDQYSSDLGFSIQREDGSTAFDLFGGLAQIAGASTPDAMIIYKYITSRDMMLAVESKINVARAFTRPDDPWYSLSPGATLEERDDHWRRMVTVFLDSGSGLIELRARAYTAEDAQAITTAIRDESARLLNELSDQAREDATRFARAEYDLASTRFASAQAELTAFRTENQIVDPSSDLAGRSALLNSLVSEQAQALIDRDLLLSTGTPESDPRFQQIERRIDVIGKRIEAERARIAVSGDGLGTGYAELVAEYDKLNLEFQMATEAYSAAKAALAAAVAKAERTTRYLAVYMPPTLSQEALYPERVTWSLLILAFSFALWSISVLTVYAIRDRR